MSPHDTTLAALDVTAPLEAAELYAGVMAPTPLPLPPGLIGVLLDAPPPMAAVELAGGTAFFAPSPPADIVKVRGRVDDPVYPSFDFQIGDTTLRLSSLADAAAPIGGPTLPFFGLSPLRRAGGK